MWIEETLSTERTEARINRMEGMPTNQEQSERALATQQSLDLLFLHPSLLISC